MNIIPTVVAQYGQSETRWKPIIKSFAIPLKNVMQPACGHRYYQPWIGHWLSADPAGIVDGINLNCMVKNNPTMYCDEHGESSRNRFHNIFVLPTVWL